MSLFLLLSVLLPLLAAIGGGVLRIEGRTWGPVGAIGSLVALVLLVIVEALGEREHAWLSGPDGLDLEHWVRSDLLSNCLLALVFVVGSIVLSFARRYLYGDTRIDYFYRWSSILLSATALMSCAVDIRLFAACWTVSGAAVLALLRMYPRHPGTTEGVKRALLAFTFGDAALWAGALLASHACDGPPCGSGPVTYVNLSSSAISLLLVVAAASRCAAFPFQWWLPKTLASPTPTSALLHAGVVNAGGLLLVRFSGVFTASASGVVLIYILGFLSAIYGSLAMRLRADVKGSLVFSTIAQMGFMLMTCGLGLYAATIFHLVTHGMYKSSLFLGSGSAIEHERRHRAAGSNAQMSSMARTLTATCALFAPLMGAAAAIALMTSIGPEALHPSIPLLTFVCSTAAWFTWAWLKRKMSLQRYLAAAVVAIIATSLYIFAIEFFTIYLDRDIPSPQNAVPPWVLIASIVLMVLAMWATTGTKVSTGKFQRQLYVWVMRSAGTSVRGRKIQLNTKKFQTEAG